MVNDSLEAAGSRNKERSKVFKREYKLFLVDV